MKEGRPLSTSCRRWFIAALACAAVLQPSAASAQPADEVERLMAEARDHYVAGRYAEAEQKAEAAWAKKRVVDIATSLGQMEHKQGKFAEAAEHLEFARKNLNVSESDQVREKIETLFAEVRKQCGAVVVRTNVSGATLKLRGRPDSIALGNEPTFVMPGEVILTLSKAGYKDATMTLVARAGETETVSLELEPTGSTEDPPTSARPIWPAIVLGITGAAGLGLGIAGIVVSEGAQSDADDAAASRASGACGPDGAACSDIDDSLSDVNTFRGLGIAGFGIAAAAGLGAVLYLVIPGDENEDQSAVRFRPLLGHTNGFLLQGNF